MECPNCGNDNMADLIIIEEGDRLRCDRCGLVFQGDE